MAARGAAKAIETSFRELVMSMPYGKITVTEICRKAHLSRKTFYDNFQDKEEILEAIFEEDVSTPIYTMNELLSLDQSKNMMDIYMENVYTPIYEDREFYERLVRPMKGVDDTFIRVVTHSLERLNKDIMGRISDASALELEYVAYFFASSQAMLMQKWIFDGMPFAPKELGALYKSMAGAYWQQF